MRGYHLGMLKTSKSRFSALGGAVTVIGVVLSILMYSSSPDFRPDVFWVGLLAGVCVGAGIAFVIVASLEKRVEKETRKDRIASLDLQLRRLDRSVSAAEEKAANAASVASTVPPSAVWAALAETQAQHAGLVASRLTKEREAVAAERERVAAMTNRQWNRHERKPPQRGSAG